MIKRWRQNERDCEMNVIEQSPDTYVVRLEVEPIPKTLDEYKEDFQVIIDNLSDLMDEVYTAAPKIYKKFESFVYKALTDWIEE